MKPFRILCAAILADVCIGASPLPRRRAYHSSVLAGEWIYIDGGEVSFEEGSRVPENQTLAIPLSVDWTNSSVTLTATDRPPTSLALNQQTLWFDETRSIVYNFGGQRSWANAEVNSIPTPPESLWQFVLDGQGSGNWTETLGPIAPKPFPSGIIRPAAGASAYDKNGSYFIGGFETPNTSPEIKGTAPNSNVPGFLTFDFNSVELTNSSNDGGYIASSWTNTNQLVVSGFMVNVDVFGPEGVLMLMGGQDFFNNISIYDKQSQRWYSQLASGDVPEQKYYMCGVGVQGGDKSTYEIYMYGGSPNSPSSDTDQIYILSLPSFTWFNVPYPPRAGRIHHTCHAVNSQLVAIGGLDPTASGDYNGTADPWPQGLGVFDMNALAWKDSFSATAPLYTPPDLIAQSVRNSTTMYPANWSSDAVRELFMNRAPVPSHKLSDGDVVGIAVSIVVIVIAVAAVLFYFYRRRTRSNALAHIAEKDSEPGSPIQEVEGDEKRIEVATRESSTAELALPMSPREVPASPRPVELPAQEGAVELVSPVGKRQGGQSFEVGRDGGQSFEVGRDGGESFESRERGESCEIGEGRELHNLVSPIEPAENRFHRM